MATELQEAVIGARNAAYYLERFRRIASRGGGCLLIAISVGAAANDNASLEKIARAHAEKFASEIGDQTIFERRFRIKSVVHPIGLRYDDSKGVGAFPGGFGPLTLRLNCVSRGKGSGSTALGVKGEFRREYCERVTVTDSEAPPFSDDIETAMSPSQYREARDQGLPVEVVVRIARPTDVPVIEFSHGTASATLTNRVERELKRWDVQVSVQSIAWYLPRAVKPFRVDELAKGEGPAPNDAMREWLDAIHAKVRANLNATSRSNDDVALTVTQLPTGEVLNVKVEKSSGDQSFDNAVERAILKSSPLPLPPNRAIFSRNLSLTFR